MSKTETKKVLNGLLGIVLALICVIVFIPMSVLASTTITGGHTTRATAYSWGSYREYSKNMYVTLPAEENDMWVKFTLKSGEKIYSRLSYDDSIEGINIEMRNSSNRIIDAEYSPDDVHEGKYIKFLAANCDNDTSSTRTYYIHVNRGTATGELYFNISLYNRIKSGRETFSFRGRATNRGNSPFSMSGADSNVLSLNLTNNSNIPPEAIVTRVGTKSRQSPNQGNVHHMILPASQISEWYVSRVSSSDSGYYTIDESDGYDAKQIWRFKYNAMATARSTMTNVKLELTWQYDIANTEYEAY